MTRGHLPLTSLNPCHCGNRPEFVTQRNGLVRIACVLGKCPDLICARAGVAERAWNEANPIAGDAPTLRQNEIPAEPYKGPWHSVLNKAPTVAEVDVVLPDWSETP